MATPIAHKGVVSGAQVVGMTMLDFIMQPQLVEDAWTYFREEQGMEQEYIPMVTADDVPATYLNTEIMDEYRPLLEGFYYDENKYESYLQQLGVTYPTIRTSTEE